MYSKFMMHGQKNIKLKHFSCLEFVHALESSIGQFDSKYSFFLSFFSSI